MGKKKNKTKNHEVAKDNDQEIVNDSAKTEQDTEKKKKKKKKQKQISETDEDNEKCNGVEPKTTSTDKQETVKQKAKEQNLNKKENQSSDIATSTSIESTKKKKNKKNKKGKIEESLDETLEHVNDNNHLKLSDKTTEMQKTAVLSAKEQNLNKKDEKSLDV